MDEKLAIFNETDEFLRSLATLNSDSFEKCVEDFTLLTEQMCTKELELKAEMPSRRSTLLHILNKVAFYPLNPTVMQEELIRLGLNTRLSEDLAGVWAETAKKVVASKKMIKGDLDQVQFEILHDVTANEESVDVQLLLSDNRNVLVNFSPDQLYAFYEQLEIIQNNIDRICK